MLLFAYICFYARYTVWSGDFAWGDRYVSTAAELAALLAVPLLVRYRQQAGSMVWMAGIALIAVSTVIQIASLPSGCRLRSTRWRRFGHPTFVIALRFKNIVAFALGKMDAWGSIHDAMHWDPWDYVHITTWNFLPFLLRRVGVAPGWVVKSLLRLDGGVVAFAATMWRVRRVVTSLPND